MFCQVGGDLLAIHVTVTTETHKVISQLFSACVENLYINFD